jgi:hypothetical protein
VRRVIVARDDGMLGGTVSFSCVAMLPRTVSDSINRTTQTRANPAAARGNHRLMDCCLQIG